MLPPNLLNAKRRLKRENKLQLQSLNQAQIDAVTAPLGPIMVLAGAGSGKTRVLTNRILYLVQECGVSPTEILAITFTNKAADEMKKRLLDFECNAEFMQISTIHSFCARVLRNEADVLQRTQNFSIYSEEDKHSLLKKVVKESFDEADAKLVDAFGESISNLKNNLPEYSCEKAESILQATNESTLADDELDHLSNMSEETDKKRLAEIIAEYSKRMSANNALDFDDLLYYVFRLFTEFPTILDKYRERYKYILIDEFQDVNRVQYSIFKMLAEKYQNIFVDGDDDQSIYSWRGADATNMIKFSNNFPTAVMYKLEQNYRSTKKILEVANNVISQNTGRFEKVLWTENEDGVKPQLFSAFSENDEACYVIEQIKSLCAYNKYRFRDCAILMRVNALSRSFEQMLNSCRIPYKVFGGFKFFERKEIRDVLAYMRLVDNPFDNEACLRAVNVPRRRGIGDTTLNKLTEFSAEQGIAIIDLLSDERNLECFNKGIRAKLKSFYDDYDGFFKLSLKVNVAEFAHRLIADLQFREAYIEMDEEERAINVDQLEEMIVEFNKQYPRARLSDYLQTVSLVSDTDVADDSDYVTISTIHAAKGLEFRAVFVVGLEEGIFPSSRSTYDRRDMQEERRLMYVAVTRAERRLYLTRAQSRFMYGERRQAMASKYYREVEKMLAPKAVPLTESQMANNDILDRAIKNQTSQPVVNPAKSKAEVSAYKVGQIVNHASFGQGIILRIDGDIAEVVFDKAGKKGLNVRFAPLTIVK